MYGDETYYGNYDLAERLMNVEYTKSSKSKKFKKISDFNNKNYEFQDMLIQSLPCNQNISRIDKYGEKFDKLKELER